MKYIIAFMALLLTIAFLGTQNGYCGNINLYIYKTGDGANILISTKNIANEQINLKMIADEKGIKPAQTLSEWDESKLNYFVRLINIDTKIEINSLNTDKKYEIINSIINNIDSQMKSGYVTTIKKEITAFDINRILDEPANDHLIKLLGEFGYGIFNANGNTLINASKEGISNVILESPFKESFAEAMYNYSKKIPKSRNYTPLYIILLFSAVIVLAIANIIQLRKYRMSQGEKLKRAGNISNMERQTKLIDDLSSKVKKEPINQDDRLLLEPALIVLNDIKGVIDQRSKQISISLPIDDIRNLMESIAKKLDGKWIEPANIRLDEIVKGKLLFGKEDFEFPIPDSLDDFKKINWSVQFEPIIDSLVSMAIFMANSPKTYDETSKRIIDSISTDIIPMIVDAVDRGKNIKDGLDTTIEDDLKRILSILGIKELDVKVGQVYNPDIHELIISSDPSLITDREQKISKIISRGLIFSNGKIIKAKVSIQK